MRVKSHHLSGLNESIKDEMGVLQLFNLENARQHALMAESMFGDMMQENQCPEG